MGSPQLEPEFPHACSVHDPEDTVSRGYVKASRIDDTTADAETLARRRALAERIEEMRARTGLTNAKIGEALGMSGETFHVALSRLKNGSRKTDPKLDWALTLSRLFGCSLDWLADGTGDWHGGFPDVPPDPGYPNRRPAVAAARMLQLSEEAVETVRAQAPAADLTPDQWFQRIYVEHTTAPRSK